MRTLVVTSWFPTKKSPIIAPFVVRDVELLEKDHDVVVLHLVNPDDLSDPEDTVPGIRLVRVLYHHTKPWTWVRAARTIAAFAQSADVVHTVALPTLLPAALARMQLPWVHTEHFSALVEEDRQTIEQRALRIFRNLLRLPDVVIAVGSSLAEAIEPIRGDTPKVIANFVRTDPDFVRDTADELGASKEIRMVSVGGLIDRKGPIQTVESLALLRDKGWDATLRWVGTGPLMEQAKARAEELGVADYVDFLGAVAPELLGEELRRANLFVLPTAAETFGVALAEALGHGLPVVTAGVGGHHEFLPKEVSRTVSERTGEAIADAAISLAQDPQRWDGKRITDYAVARFSDEVRRKEYLEAYNHALDSGRSQQKTEQP